MPKVTEQGFSFNKKTGAGFGLSYAKHYLEQINGSLHIHSEESIGTKIKITLIRSNPPSWFCNSMNIRHGTNIVVLDDDISIHDAWNDRFANISQIQIFHFYNATDLLQYKVDPEIPILYLIDYELLADVTNGLDLIEELKLNDKAILVTSCFEDSVIRKRCENIDVKIIPKSYVPLIKIIEISKKEYIDMVVFIDDDEMMRMTWIFAAEEAGQSISAYSTFDEFLNEINNYDENTLIYIDSDLGNNVRGEDCAEILFSKGFVNVHLATGYLRDQFSYPMPWIKTIVGKEPPFRFTDANLI